MAVCVPWEKPKCENQITTDKFGCAHDGREVTRYTMRNKLGMVLQVIDFGATITSIQLPTKCGMLDVVLGFDDMRGYLSGKNAYFGATIGRVTNRTKPTKLKLNGQCVSLTTNFGRDVHLHGGCKGFSQQLWKAEAVGGVVQMKYKSRDGEEGYPGNLEVVVSFSVTEQNEVSINYSAFTDALTLVNLTNHAYFNLAGHNAGSEALMEHQFLIESDTYTELCDMIATGKIVVVDDTGYDFREPRLLGDAMECIEEDGYDINYCLRPPMTCLKRVVKVCYRPKCILMELYSNSPCLQFYTGNKLDKVCGKEKSMYNKFAGFCLECQGFPNAANIPKFLSIELKPGEEYRRDILLKFTFPSVGKGCTGC